MSGFEDQLPEPFREALAFLRQNRDANAQVDSTKDNFAYLWVSNLAKNTPGEARGGWLRLPLAFPQANPHGLITKDALLRGPGGNVADAHHPNHDMCAPVKDLGGAHYYSWTWGNCPPLNSPEDILLVVQWYERTIRNA